MFTCIQPRISLLIVMSMFLSLSLVGKTGGDEIDTYDFLSSRSTNFIQQKIEFPLEINEQNIQNYILNNWPNFQNEEAGIALISEKYSPGGIH